MNSYILNYDTQTLILNFNGQEFRFDLTKGDIGDHWDSFTDKDGVIRDINFVQDDENEAPSLSVYGTKVQAGYTVIDMQDEEYIKDFTQIGDPLCYFNFVIEDEPACEKCGGQLDGCSSFICTSCAKLEDKEEE